MTAPICGARTWVTPDEMATCEREHGHDGQHRAVVGFGIARWADPMCCLMADAPVVFPSPSEARALVTSLQAQLDALDPDAAIAEAERRMVEARRHADDMARLASMYSRGPGDPLRAAHDDAVTRLGVAVSAWRLLVEARDAKGGGA